ncbi:hypothetical protein [Methyloglobulus sp.]|uniref:hypothetical protein n=1 Tax=Methyloglobulus sp. TaxID=2518622 RepID=UPI003988D048
MKWLAAYIMRGRLEAMLLASTLAMLSLMLAPLSVLSSGAVALVTLRKGAYEGLIVFASSSLAAAVLATLIQVPYTFILLYVLVLWLPIWLIAIVLREGRHISLTVEIAVLIGVVGVIGYYLFNADPAAMWKQVMPRMVPPNAPVENVKQMIDLIAPYMTGIAAAGAVFSMLLGLFLGRWWQAMLFNPGGFRQEFLGLKVQPRLAVISIATIGIAIASSGVVSQIAWNTTILMFVLYTFIGTAVLHTVFSRMKIGKYAVPMFYITLFFIPHSLLPVALVGLSDTWLDIRKRTLNQT